MNEMCGAKAAAFGLAALSVCCAFAGVSMKGSPDVSFRDTAVAKASARSALLARQHGAKPIQRTMKALAESTRERPAHVRLSFYGQSIVGQQWHALVVDDLRRRYPTAVIEAENRAIGGYESPNLVRTAESDLYPTYADLVFFHVYGPMDKYEAVVRKLRETTTAEVVLWTSHMTRRDSATRELVTQAAEGWDARSQSIADIAARYGCLFVDLRTKWARMILEKGYTPDDLLGDSIHLKTYGPGFAAYARFLSEALVRLDGETGMPEHSGTITSVAFADRRVMRKADGSVELTFDGNRVAALSDGSGVGCADVLLDGRPVREFASMYVTTRPSALVSWMPMIRHVDIAPGVQPTAEDWTLTFLEGTGSHGRPIRYKVEGSRTGYDGEGWSTNDFRSASGRAVITAADFQTGIWQYDYFLKDGRNAAKDSRPGQKITWAVRPLFADPFGAAKTSGAQTVLVQNCANGRHVLTLRPRDGAKLGISGFVVNRPARCAGQKQEKGKWCAKQSLAELVE